MMDRNEMQQACVDAALDGAAEHQYAASAGELATPIYAWSLASLLKQVSDLAIEYGKAHRADIEAAAQAAIDKLVALDIPGIPDFVEATLDAAAKQLGYEAVAKLLDALLGVQTG